MKKANLHPQIFLARKCQEIPTHCFLTTAFLHHLTPAKQSAAATLSSIRTVAAGKLLATGIGPPNCGTARCSYSAGTELSCISIVICCTHPHIQIGMLEHL